LPQKLHPFGGETKGFEKARQKDLDQLENQTVNLKNLVNKIDASSQAAKELKESRMDIFDVSS
jgi:hypothetical protein